MFKNRKLIFNLVVILLINIINGQKFQKSNDQPLSENFIQNNNKFSMKLYNEISKIQKNSFIFSPFSIQLSGALLMNGARGETAVEIREGFNLCKVKKVPGIDKDRRSSGKSCRHILKHRSKTSNLKLANGLFLRKDLELSEDFEKNAKSYNMHIENIDFETNEFIDRINNWVNENTNGKIQNVIDENGVDQTVQMLLINTIYFKGIWSEKFLKMFTQKSDFYVTPNKTVQFDMMYADKSYKVGIDNKRNIMIGEFAYENSDISMMIIKPTNSKFNINFIEKILIEKGLKNLLNEIDLEEVNGSVMLPKFTSKTEINLKQVLENLGLTKMFSGEADFSKFLSTEHQLSVSKAIHKAIIEVNEEGTEAAGYTGFEIEDRIGGGPVNIFRADHSFVYLLKGKQNEIYFMGRFNG